MTIPLSVLDLSPVSAGSTPQQALRNTIELAQLAERLGYHRFWVAEHHFVRVASAAPTTLIGLIAAATESIRVGSAAVQLGHHTSASVVEAFGTIDALYPGRLDLGLGRSGHRGGQLRSAAAQPTTAPAAEPVEGHAARTVAEGDARPVAEGAARPAAEGAARPVAEPAAEPVADRVTEVRGGVVIPPPFNPAKLLDFTKFAAGFEALQLPGAQSLPYTEQVQQISDLLAGTYTSADGVALHAVPGEGADVQLWLFGSSGGESAQLAGRSGLPFAANYHVSPGTILETVEAYRKAFRPSARFPRPYLVVSADVVVAEDDATARHLASSYGHWVYSIRSGAGAAEYLDPATAPPLTEAQRELVEDRLTTQFVGSPATVVERLTALQQLTGADELVITSVTYDHQDRLNSHRLLAREWGLSHVRAA